MKDSNTVAVLETLGACKAGLDYARTFTTLAEAWDQCERPDWMFWYLKRKSLLDKTTSVKLAVACAERVLQHFESWYPEDKRPRLAIEAALKYIQNPSDDAADAAYGAADAAYDDAADAAYGAAAYAAYDAAAYAARAAARAARAAARAAAYDAADDAADAAAGAADAAARAGAAEQKWQANKIRELLPNPFL